MLDELNQKEGLRRALLNFRRVVVLTGAGISAESGVPTFREKGGLWGKYNPEELATARAFQKNPQLVWEWYQWRRWLISEVKPNPGHYAIAEMERLFDDFSLITQNVDGLHRAAGSMIVLEMHGNIMRNKCFDCGKVFDGINLKDKEPPRCDGCGGLYRPDVVWFGEMLPSDVLYAAFQSTQSCELFFSIGTSALVHPAASLPIEAMHSGAYVIEINPQPTVISHSVDHTFLGPSGEILPQIVDFIKANR